MALRLLILSALVAVLLLIPSREVQTSNVPPGFVETTVGEGWDQVVGMTFDDSGRMFVWERKGRVWIVEDGVRHEHPFIDISDEVGGWRDYGLLGFALHPDFEHTGHVYLLYVVDHHHLQHAGTPSYDPGANEYFRATIGRITRYTAELPTGHDHYDHAHDVDLSSRRILLGESIDTGFPIVHQSHGIGTLVFGTDGTLLASCGDGASYTGVDTGGDEGSSGTGSYYKQALAEGIIDERQDVGAYRSQLLSSLNGKVVRVDAATGDGVPSNPFFEPGAPRSARSRTWALGLRNPFRMCLRPGTGSHFASAGDPGVLYIGDVGWGTWEELNVADKPGMNFGWPAFEGMTKHSGYWSSEVENLDAPNPLSGQAGCSQPYFFFRDLIQQDTLAENPVFPNPCQPSVQIPASLDRFVHARPALDWKHGSDRTRVGVFNGSTAAISELGDADCPVSGAGFRGNCAVGGAWYEGDAFPPQYQNTYFQADYGGKWIRAFRFGSDERPTAVSEFIADAGGVVAVATCPADGCLYYIRWASEILKVSYVPAGNQPPVAVASADLSFGPAPLNVQLVGSGSSDPEGGSLSYEWDFGDGSEISTLPNPSHLFDAPAGTPTPYTVKLTVRDGGRTDLGNHTSRLAQQHPASGRDHERPRRYGVRPRRRGRGLSARSHSVRCGARAL